MKIRKQITLFKKFIRPITKKKIVYYLSWTHKINFLKQKYFHKNKKTKVGMETVFFYFPKRKIMKKKVIIILFSLIYILWGEVGFDVLSKITIFSSIIDLFL